MLHLVLYALGAIALGGVLFAVAARFLPAGEQIAPPVRDEPPWELPLERAMRPEEVDAVRLPVALRGYRFAETDILLDRLADELRARDAEIARLRDGAPHDAEPAAVETGAAPQPADVAEPDEHLEEELAVAEAVNESPGGERAAIEPASDEQLEPEPRHRRRRRK